MIENVIKNYGLYIIIAETVIIIALLLWRLFFSEYDSQEIDSYKRKIKILSKKLNDEHDSSIHYKKECDQAKMRLKQYEQNKHLLTKQEPKSNVIELESSQKQKQQVDTRQVLYQYLQEAIDGKFIRLLSSSEKCYFRTWEEGGVRKYEFCGNVAKAIANINAIFDDVCEIEGKRSGATDIENVCAGTLDSELRIISKAKIRLK
ncbi:MAG: hypothetical protein J6M59_02010 [Bacteroidaceae bacterium]|nr:hypothetical protein [Bacteroidaceae bacterium]